MRKQQEGFTLVELMVTIVCVSVVTFAVMSFMLMGTRVSAASSETAGRQQTVRIVLTMLEKMAGSGQIKTVEASGDNWQLLDEHNSVLLEYSAAQQTLSAGGSVLLEDLRMAQAEISDSSLLTISLETEDGVYESSVYCRSIVKEEGTGSAEILDLVKNEETNTVLSGAEEMSDTEKAGRYAFLAVLATQYGSTGRIRNTDGTYGWYYSQWYCDPKNGNYWTGWNEKTPWCACFASWGMARMNTDENTLLETVPSFSGVVFGVEGFQDGSFGTWNESGAEGGAVPTPGDLIFFDWMVPENPDHVGVVLYVKDGIVYTIEGNSGGRVAVCAYALDDTRIMGYGVLKWKTEAGS